MNSTLFYVLVLVSSSLLSFPLDPYKSALQRDGETFEQIISNIRHDDESTVMSHRKKVEDLDLSVLPEWEDVEFVSEKFEYVRDLKFLKTEEQPNLMRRSSWLYPDNGCYARASLMIENLSKAKVELPWKVFIFGNLKVKTENHPRGYVKWWYHVVPIIKVGSEAYILDPAIDHHEPLTLEEWALRQVKELDSATFSICHASAYTPSSTCLGSSKMDLELALEDQNDYLATEWIRQLNLDRDPYIVLGENPPWLK